MKTAGVQKQFPGANMASAATVNLANATGNTFHITGNTGPITSFGTTDAGTIFYITFDSTPTITHNATSLILPGGANIVATAGDNMILKSEGGGNYTCLVYTPKDGTPVIDVAAPSALLDSTIPAGEAITAGQSVFVETVPTANIALTATVVPAATFPAGSVTSKTGMKVTFTAATKVITVNKNASVGATTCYIQTAAASGVLATATFSGNVATFDYEVAAGTYYIMVDSAGSMYTYTQSPTSPTYPTLFTGGSYVAGASNGSEFSTFTFGIDSIIINSTFKNIGDVSNNTRISFPVFGTGVAASTIKLAIAKKASPSVTFSVRIETDNAGSPSGTPVTNGTGTIAAASVTTSLVDTTITLAGPVTLTDGVKYHLVLFAGTYGSETVNATNYYHIGYTSTDTTTRPSKTWNGSVWSSAVSTTFCYSNSTLFRDSVLSLTDADFSYKVDMYGFAAETKAVGLFPKITISGVNANQSGLTTNSTYYLSGTPGATSTTPGTNSVQAGSAVGTTQILVSKLSKNPSTVVSGSGVSGTATVSGFLNVNCTSAATTGLTLTINGVAVAVFSTNNGGQNDIPLAGYIRSGQSWTLTGNGTVTTATWYITPIV